MTFTPALIQVSGCFILLMHASGRKGWQGSRSVQLHPLSNEMRVFAAMQNDPKHAGKLLSICQTPFILTPAAKSYILQGEAFLQKRSEMQTSGLQVC